MEPEKTILIKIAQAGRQTSTCSVLYQCPDFKSYFVYLTWNTIGTP